MTTQLHYLVNIRSTVTYPENVSFHKHDFFAINSLEVKDYFWEMTIEEKYQYLNDGGFWVSGWQDITPEMEPIIDRHSDNRTETAEKITIVDTAANLIERN